MRGIFRRGGALSGMCVAGLAVLVAAGCQVSTRSGLPEHIRSVEIHVFENKTMYHGVEGILTRGVIDRVNADPRVRVAGRGGDAVLTGEITGISMTTLRETTTNEPGTVQVVVEATFSFYDNVNGRYLFEDKVVTSADSGVNYGIYEASRGETYEEGVGTATAAVAAEIARRTIGMW